MEGWQKGAKAVIRMSGAGRENYFKNFPERREWFHSNYPEHFGRSAAGATRSLRKTNNARDAAKKIADMRFNKAVEASSNRVRAMGDRRRESGEGLGGGLETNRDIIAHAAAGNYIKSGGLGSLFEQEESPATDEPEEKKEGVYQKNGKWYYNDTSYSTKEEAEQAEQAEQAESNDRKLRDELLGSALKILNLGDAKDKAYPKKKDSDQSKSQKSQTPPQCRFGPCLPPDRSGDFRDRRGISVDGVTPPPSDEPFIPWAETNPDWGANLGMEYPTNRIDTETERELLQKPQTSAGDKTMREKRKSLSDRITIRANEEYAKELAEKTIQECMPMPDSSMPLKMRVLMMKSKDQDEGSDESEAEEEPGEYDYEGDMAKSQLRSIMHNSKMLHDMLEDNTNLPEWVQSKITLAEDYILTAANYMRGEMMNEETEDVNAIHQSMQRTMEKDLPFDPNAERPEMPPGKQPAGYRYVSGLARRAMKAGIAATVQPTTHEDLVGQHMDLHNQVTEGRSSAAVRLQRAFERAQAESAISRARGEEILAQARAQQAQQYVNDHMALHAPVPLDDKNAAGEQLDEMDNYDMINRDALPVPPHRNIRGVQDRINAGKRKDAAAAAAAAKADESKKKKIMTKVGKAIQKKRMTLPTDNPSANELVPRSMLPDVPGYPKGYQMQEQVAEQLVEQQVEAPVIEENVSPFVAAGSKFLTRTSTRLVYGEKNE